MLSISETELENRMRFDNPWWESGAVPADIAELPERDYFKPLFRLIEERTLRRAVVLLGPRRVGKTIMMQQAIKRLLRQGHAAQSILFVSLDTPLFTGIPLEKILQLYLQSYGGPEGAKTIFFDEIQYLRDWEVHLKSLVDSYRDFKFVVSGSAAAALSRGARESGAGRFTEFLLPPLTFAEFLRLTDHPLRSITNQAELLSHIRELNAQFLDYINFGGYPELALSKAAKANPMRYIGQDIVEKVLLRDLPTLYGIKDVNELQHLFKVLAFNSGQEVSLDALSQKSQVAKNTIKKYIDYLEAAFLIRTVNRIDFNAKRFQRQTHFKVYLTNPSLRTALFSPIRDDDDDVMGAMAETAIFAQWFHLQSFDQEMQYSRDKDGEIDLVHMEQEKPNWVVEIKWTDRFYDRPSELEYLLKFAAKHENSFSKPSDSILITTKTKSGALTLRGIPMRFIPTAMYCLNVGSNLTGSQDLIDPAHRKTDDEQGELNL